MKLNNTIFLIIIFFCVSTTVDATIYNVKDFGAYGDGKHNDNAAFVKLSAKVNEVGGNCTINIPKGTYKVGFQKIDTLGIFSMGGNVIDLKNCNNVIIEGNNSTLIYKDSLYYGSFDPKTKLKYDSKETVFADYKYGATIGSIINIISSNKITIRNLTLNGNNTTYKIGGKFGDIGIQLPSNGMCIKNVNNVEINNVISKYFGLDGLLIGCENPNNINNNIVIQNSKFLNNGRQGMSIVGGTGFYVYNCEFSYTGKGTVKGAPGAGIDVEAEWGKIRNVYIKKCKFIDNKGSGYISDSGDSDNLTLDNCFILNYDYYAIYNSRTNFNLLNSTVYGSIINAGAYPKKEQGVLLKNCYFSDTIVNGKQSNNFTNLEVNNSKFFDVINCTFNSRYFAKVMWITGDNINLEEQPYFENCTFNINTKPFPSNDFLFIGVLVKFKNCKFNLDCKQSEMKGKWFQTDRSKDLGGNSTNYLK